MKTKIFISIVLLAIFFGCTEDLNGPPEDPCLFAVEFTGSDSSKSLTLDSSNFDKLSLVIQIGFQNGTIRVSESGSSEIQSVGLTLNEDGTPMEDIYGVGTFIRIEASTGSPTLYAYDVDGTNTDFSEMIIDEMMFNLGGSQASDLSVCYDTIAYYPIGLQDLHLNSIFEFNSEYDSNSLSYMTGGEYSQLAYRSLNFIRLNGEMISSGISYVVFVPTTKFSNSFSNFANQSYVPSPRAYSTAMDWWSMEYEHSVLNFNYHNTKWSDFKSKFRNAWLSGTEEELAQYLYDYMNKFFYSTEWEEMDLTQTNPDGVEFSYTLLRNRYLFVPMAPIDFSEADEGYRTKIEIDWDPSVTTYEVLDPFVASGSDEFYYYRGDEPKTINIVSLTGSQPFHFSAAGTATPIVQE